MSDAGALPLPVVDARELDEDRRAALRPGEELCDRDGGRHRLPVYFYEVESWELARRTSLAAHFTLHEFMVVDVREAAPVRQWPRYVPCGITLLAPALELLRREAGSLVWVAANGGYRSPSHALTTHASPHCWATAANLYRIGDDALDSRESIERYGEMALRSAPGLRMRPFGHGKGEADDHLHLDLGYATLVPGGRDG